MPNAFVMKKLREVAAQEIERAVFNLRHPYCVLRMDGTVERRFSNFAAAEETARYMKMEVRKESHPAVLTKT